MARMAEFFAGRLPRRRDPGFYRRYICGVAPQPVSAIVADILAG